MSEPRELSSTNAEARIPNAEDRRAAFRGRMNSSRSRAPNLFSRSRSRGRAEEERPSLARRFSRSKSRSRKEVDEPKRQLSKSLSRRKARSISSLDKDSADLPPPQMMPLDCTNIQCNAESIGIALGSPSQLQPASLDQHGRSPSSTKGAALLNSTNPRADSPTSKSKGARWRRIGGLFRAKNAFLNEPTPLPFYQLQSQYAAEMAIPSDVGFRSRSAGPIAQEQEARFLSDKILGSDGQLDPQKSARGPLHQKRLTRGRTKESAERLGHSLARRPHEQTPSAAGLPLLDVKIPEVQLERYSVMFGSLLEKQEPSKLLSRRDRELNQLLTFSDEKERPCEVVPVLNQEPETFERRSNSRDQSQLSSNPNTTYPRRVTSPEPSKSPSFSLFPQLPQAPEKIVGPVPPGKQSPLRRSFTAPARLSPMQEAFRLGEVEVSNSEVPKTDDKVVTTPPYTASTWDLKRDSADPAYLSPISSRLSATEDLLVDIESLGPAKGSQDQPEVTVDQELKVAPLRPRHVNKDTKGTNVQNQQVETQVENKVKTDVHEDTLAALERPRSIGSKSKGVSSFSASPARIDQIMRGPTPNERTKGSAETKTSRAIPEASKSNANTEMVQESIDAPAQRGRAASNVGGSAAAPNPLSRRPSAVSSSGQEIPAVPDQAHPNSETVFPPMQPSTEASQPSPDNSSVAVKAVERQLRNTAHPLAKSHQNVVDVHPRRLSPPYQTGRRRPPQTAVAQRQPRPFAGNTYHSIHPQTRDVLPARPTLNAANRSFPTYRSPPQHFVMPLQPRFNQMQPRFNRMHPPFNQMHRPPRPQPLPEKTPPTELDQDNILDYYLEDSEAKPSSEQFKSPNKLQKRQSNISKKRFSLSSKPVSPSDPRSESIGSQTSNTAPRSPVPISKYSANAAAIQRSAISSNTSGENRHYHTLSESSTFAKQTSGQRNPVSSAHVADDKVGQINKSPSVQNPVLPRSHSVSTVSNLPRRAMHTELSLIIDDSNTTHPSETPSDSHSNANTPSHRHATSGPPSPSQTFGFVSANQDGKPPIPKRSPSRGASLSSLPPPGAGEAGRVGFESRSTTPRLVIPSTRSASAGTVGMGAGNGTGFGAAAGAGTPGIQDHLKPEKGEKVVERQAGLVPRIVDPQRGHDRGHRAEKSVNLIIESV